MIRSFSVTDVGRKRKLNQDYVFASDVRVGGFPNLFMVADGMGGHRAGDFASKFTADTVVEELQRHPSGDRKTLISNAVTVANRRLRDKAAGDELLSGMGTTFLLTSVDSDRLLTANIGDSRLYVISQGEISQITRDHSLVEEMVRMGGIDRETALARADKNIITRAVGAMDEVEADFFETRLHDGDRILLCSDGLTNMIEDDEIRRIVSSTKEIDDAALRLVETANEHGGRDNIAVILIEYSGETR